MKFKTHKSDELTNALKHLKISEKQPRHRAKKSNPLGLGLLLQYQSTLESNINGCTSTNTQRSASFDSLSPDSYCRCCGRFALSAQPCVNNNHSNTLSPLALVPPSHDTRSYSTITNCPEDHFVSGFSPFTPSAGLLLSTLPIHTCYNTNSNHIDQFEDSNSLKPFRRSCFNVVDFSTTPNSSSPSCWYKFNAAIRSHSISSSCSSNCCSSLLLPLSCPRHAYHTSHHMRRYHYHHYNWSSLPNSFDRTRLRYALYHRPPTATRHCELKTTSALANIESCYGDRAIQSSHHPISFTSTASSFIATSSSPIIHPPPPPSQQTSILPTNQISSLHLPPNNVQQKQSGVELNNNTARVRHSSDSECARIACSSSVGVVVSNNDTQSQTYAASNLTNGSRLSWSPSDTPLDLKTSTNTNPADGFLQFRLSQLPSTAASDSTSIWRSPSASSADLTPSLNGLSISGDDGPESSRPTALSNWTLDLASALPSSSRTIDESSSQRPSANQSFRLDEDVDGGQKEATVDDNGVDLSVNELAAYMDTMMYIPGRMSEMAQRMYL